MNDERWLTREWMQQGLDALRETVDANPDLKRQMIEFLFDTGMWDSTKLRADNAITRFNACLNPDQPETFKTMHIWALMKRFGRHQLFLAMAADLGYEVHRIPTEARRQAALENLAAAIEKSNDEVAQARAVLDGIYQDGVAVRPHPAFNRGGSFCLPVADRCDFGGY